MPISRRIMLSGSLALPMLAAAWQAKAATHEVTIEGFKFVPAELAVTVGDTVVFTNKDSAPHTATGDSFDTGRLGNGQSAEVTISSAGEHPYICKIHPRMKGVITAS